MERKDNARGQIAEKIIKTDYEICNIKICPLIIAKMGNILNKEKLSVFLENHEKREDILSILEDLNTSHKLLPDFILIDASNKVFFVEVKSRSSKVTLSNTEERDAIKILADKGYKCLIKNVKIPTLNNMSEEEIEEQLKDYGKIMKGISNGKQLYYLNFIEEKFQSEPYSNVFIWDITVKLK
jgi:hypothetical protein